MRLDTIQSLVIILMVALATQITRWTPFLLFSGERKLPRVVEDLGKLLPPAMMGLLVVYSLRSTDLLGGSHGIPEVLQTTDVMAAQTAWLQAQSQKIDAEIDVRLSQVNLKKALGVLQ